MAKFLYALEGLPCVTPGVFMVITVSERIQENLRFASVTLNARAFSLSTGGVEYYPDVGSEGYEKEIFVVRAGGFREGTTQDFRGWLGTYDWANGPFSFEDHCEDHIDLTDDAPEDGWDKLAAYWEWRGDAEFDY